MADITLTNDTSNELWTYSPQIDKKTDNILILNTKNKFIDKNIKITPIVNDASGYSLAISKIVGSSVVSIGKLSNGYYPITANNLKVTGTLTAATPGWFVSDQATDKDTDKSVIGKIAAAQGTITMIQGNGKCDYIADSSANITVSDTDTSGIKIAFQGSGAMNATASTTAGYTPINDSYATGTMTYSNTTLATKYITGVNLTKGKIFSITVPNGSDNDTITFVFKVDSENNVTVEGP